jgi:hypothetical protein
MPSSDASLGYSTKLDCEGQGSKDNVTMAVLRFDIQLIDLDRIAIIPIHPRNLANVEGGRQNA